MTERLCQWSRGAGFAAIRSAWLERAAGCGNPIRVRLADREVYGIFDTIDESGRLLLRHGGGELEAITAGEVFPVHGISAHTVGAGSPQMARVGAFR
jgi:BirA family biotin operon repressor/biotin-[acetyl-CoA-carboxylase] ligase